MDEAERLLVQRGNAAIIDHPSLYMGGPSRNSMRKANSVIDALLAAKRLVSTTCDHQAWVKSTTPIHHRGIYCPACNTILTQEQMACLSDAGESGG